MQFTKVMGIVGSASLTVAMTFLTLRGDHLALTLGELGWVILLSGGLACLTFSTVFFLLGSQTENRLDRNSCWSAGLIVGAFGLVLIVLLIPGVSVPLRKEWLWALLLVPLSLLVRWWYRNQLVYVEQRRLGAGPDGVQSPGSHQQIKRKDLPESTTKHPDGPAVRELGRREIKELRKVAEAKRLAEMRQAQVREAARHYVCALRSFWDHLGSEATDALEIRCRQLRARYMDAARNSTDPFHERVLAMIEAIPDHRYDPRFGASGESELENWLVPDPTGEYEHPGTRLEWDTHSFASVPDQGAAWKSAEIRVHETLPQPLAIRVRVNVEVQKAWVILRPKDPERSGPVISNVVWRGDRVWICIEEPRLSTEDIVHLSIASDEQFSPPLREVLVATEPRSLNVSIGCNDLPDLEPSSKTANGSEPPGHKVSSREVNGSEHVATESVRFWSKARRAFDGLLSWCNHSLALEHGLPNEQRGGFRLLAHDLRDHRATKLRQLCEEPLPETPWDRQRLRGAQERIIEALNEYGALLDRAFEIAEAQRPFFSGDLDAQLRDLAVDTYEIWPRHKALQEALEELTAVCAGEYGPIVRGDSLKSFRMGAARLRSTRLS